jgi:catechol 2,3-dioxygenase-like lactoylglutathione lyase family enzyme
MKGRPVVFVPSSDPRRAARWYVAKLGMKHVSDDAYASVLRDGAITVRLARVENVEPAPYTILGWEVANLDRVLRALRTKRVKPIRYPGMGQGKDGVWKSPGGARVAWIHDRDGNVLSLTQLPR